MAASRRLPDIGRRRHDTIRLLRRESPKKDALFPSLPFSRLTGEMEQKRLRSSMGSKVAKDHEQSRNQ